MKPSLIGLVFLKKTTNTLYQVVSMNKPGSKTRLCLCMSLHEEKNLTFTAFHYKEIMDSSDYFFCNKERDTLAPTAISPVIMKLLPVFAKGWLVRVGVTIHDNVGKGKLLSINWNTNEAMVKRLRSGWFGFTKRSDYLVVTASELLPNFPMEYSEGMFEYIKFNMDMRAKH